MPDDGRKATAADLDELRQAIDDAIPVDPGAGGGGIGGPPDDDDGEPPSDRELAAYDQNDTGNAERLIARYGANLVYVDQNGWAAWDKRRFAYLLGDAEAIKLCHLTVAKIRDEVQALRDLGPPPPSALEEAETDPTAQALMRAERIKGWEKSIAKFQAFAVTSGNAGKVAGMLDMARPYLSRPASAMDGNPWLLTVDNGTLDLSQKPETVAGMRVRTHRRADLITRLATVTFDPEARCPRFEAFITRILPDEEVRRFVQKLLGYCLSGSTAEQIFVIFYGTGRNGKSVLIDLTRKTFGDYAATVPVGVFLDDRNKKADGPRPSLAKLPGVRLALMSEPDKGQALSEGLVKEVTGGEPLAVRKLNQDEFEFRPAFTPIMVTNHKPIIRGQDAGIWGRVVLVPFEVFIPPEERDPQLIDKLMEERPGFLNWLLDGLWMFFEEGLDPPEKIKAAVEEYQKDSDPIGDFLESEVITQPGEKTNVSEVYDRYEKWCQQNATDPLTKKAFANKMKDKGFRTTKISVNYWVGIKLLPERASSSG